MLCTYCSLNPALLVNILSITWFWYGSGQSFDKSIELTTFQKLVLLSIALLISVAYAVQPIKVQGADFVNSVTNARFQIIGVAYAAPDPPPRDLTDLACSYQPGGSAGFMPQLGVDPLSNGTTCLRDAALMQMLGINTVRIYNLDPTINHDECASIFNDVGIYMILDVNTPLPNESINSGDPSSSYDSTYLEQIFGVVEAFKTYPNTLGFFSANEVIDATATAATDPPYIRAVTRDLKNYIAKHSSRTIPVGYSAADVRPVLVDTWEYLQCAINGSTSDMSRSDFFGLNSYSWCGPTATYESSGYNVLVADFSNTTIPVFFSEYGCNIIEPRVWDEVQTLYSPMMTGVMSGGLAYEFTEDSNNFGLVIVSANGSATLRVDYDNLQAQLNKLNISALESANSTATTLTPPSCSSSLIDNSGFDNQFNIPDVPPGGQELIDNGISNPNNGQLVQVTQLNVTVSCFASDGVQLQGLAIKPLHNNQSNSPTGQNSSGTATTGGPSPASVASPTSTTGSAVRAEMGSVMGSVVMGALAMWCL